MYKKDLAGMYFRPSLSSLKYVFMHRYICEVVRQLIFSMGIVRTLCAAGHLPCLVDIRVQVVALTSLRIPEKVSPELVMVHWRPRL